MIELCNKRRMVIAIIALGVLTVIVLILEEKLTSDHHFSQSPTPGLNNESHNFEHLGASQPDRNIKPSPSPSTPSSGRKECWKFEDFKIVTECAPCTRLEVDSGSIPECQETGLKETVHCKVTGAVFRSCTNTQKVEKVRFWIFEGLMLFLAVSSYGYCKYRTSQLERATIKKIERRLASGL